MGRLILHNVQAARFLAAASVLVGHSADLLLPAHSPIFAMRWNFGVDIFFIISGFIMAYLTRGHFGEAGAPRAFLLRRIVRIVPPYWLFTTLMIAAAFLFSAHVKNATLEPIPIITSYGFIPWPRADGELYPILSQGWTLNYEMFFYVAFSAALLFKRGLAFLTAGFMALVLIGPSLPPELFVLRFWSNPVILEFLAGIGLALLYLRGVRLPLWVAMLCIGAGIAFTVRSIGFDVGMFDRANHALAALLICAALILKPEPKRLNLAARMVRHGGDASYALYLSHTFTVNALLLVFRGIGVVPPLVAMVATMAVAQAVAILIYRGIERPMTDWLQRMTGARPLRGAAAIAP